MNTNAAFEIVYYLGTTVYEGPVTLSSISCMAETSSNKIVQIDGRHFTFNCPQAGSTVFGLTFTFNTLPPVGPVNMVSNTVTFGGDITHWSTLKIVGVAGGLLILVFFVYRFAKKHRGGRK